MTRPSHPPRLDYSNYTWRRVQIMKLLVMPFFPFTRHLIPLRSKYPAQYPFLKRLQSPFDQVPHPHKTTDQIIVVSVLTLNCADSRQEEERPWLPECHFPSNFDFPMSLPNIWTLLHFFWVCNLVMKDTCEFDEIARVSILVPIASWNWSSLTSGDDFTCMWRWYRRLGLRMRTRQYQSGGTFHSVT
jgi:hypothetical protein